MTRVTVASVDSERRIDFYRSQRVEALADDLVDVRCHREVAFHHHAEVSDGLQRFHVDITDMERTVVYLMNVSRGRASQDLCL